MREVTEDSDIGLDPQLALLTVDSAQTPVQPHGQEDQNDQTPEPNPNQESGPS